MTSLPSLLVRGALAASALLLVAGCGATVTPPDDSEPTSVDALSGVERVVVLGDSITLGVNACGTGPCAEASWASGTDPAVRSLAQRVGAVAPGVEVVPLARDGARLDTAIQNLDAILGEQPGLLVVLLGANDACATSIDEMTEPDTFRAQLTELLAGLRAGAPDAPILVMSLIDVNRAWEVGHDVDAAVRAWNSSRSCDALLADPDSTTADATARRDLVADRVDAFNAIIAEECRADASCFGDDGALHRLAFEASDLSSTDFFHPSIAGQAKIAAAVWDALSAVPAPAAP